MLRKVFFGLLWLALVAYSLISANALSGTFAEDLDLIIRLCLGEWSGINPLIITIFYLMGIFPIVYAALILFDRNQQISPTTFVICSFGVGAFALLPYLVLRQRDRSWNGHKTWLQKILDSRLTAIITSVAVIVLITWGITQGDWSDFAAQWQTSQFIHVMSLDFLILCCLFIAILEDDQIRRGIDNSLLKTVALLPLFGVLIYWCLRPQLPDTANLRQSVVN